MNNVILSGYDMVSPTSIEDYVNIGGFDALKKAIKMKAQDICEELKISTLKGRGGAAYPTGVKWEQALAVEGSEKYILCNGDEGEPGTFKDKVILEKIPLKLVEGMIIAAKVLNANKGYIYIRGEYSEIQQIVQAAIDNARLYGYLGENILESGINFDIKILTGAGAYVVGENSALAESAEGKVGRPRMKPPYIKECGLYGKPTLVNNIETFTAVPSIVLNGGNEFKEHGNGVSGGTKLISLCGNVNRRGVYEVPFGTTIREIINELGSGIKSNKKLKAVQIGGSSGCIIPESLIDTELCYDTLKNINVSMGSGSILVIDEDIDMVEFLLYIYKFFYHESCGKCTPCREGNKQLVNVLDKIVSRNGTEEDIKTIERLLQVMKDASFCGLGKTAPAPLKSALKYFKEDFRKILKEDA